jgi:16S rRNA (adenine1518-N6/adenine1519-N6)-dimethyltransferase
MTEVRHHRARKRFGQNFLVDPNIIDKIVGALAPGENDNLIEIGPGQGALTEPLLATTPCLQVIEVDRDLAADLRKRFGGHPGFRLYEGDALAFDFGKLGTAEQPLRVVGNLPYNISTPLLFHLLNYESVIGDMHFMLQREVVDRMTAGPGSKTYGRLGIIAQYHCRIDFLFPVPATCFRPVPQVESAIVRLVPHRQKPYLAQDPVFFRKVVKLAFQQRRKTLRNALKPLMDSSRLNELDIDLNARPETLSVSDFVHLSNRILTLK